MRLSIIKNALKITIIIAILFLSMLNVSQAKSIETTALTQDTDITTVSFSEWAGDAKNFLDRGQEEQPITTQDAIEAFLPVGRILVGIATIVLVVVGLIFGVKYMIAGANDKAQLKQKLIYYIISIVLVYGAVGIFTLIVNVMNAIIK